VHTLWSDIFPAASLFHTFQSVTDASQEAARRTRSGGRLESRPPSPARQNTRVGNGRTSCPTCVHMQAQASMTRHLPVDLAAISPPHGKVGPLLVPEAAPCNFHLVSTLEAVKNASQAAEMPLKLPCHASLSTKSVPPFFVIWRRTCIFRACFVSRLEVHRPRLPAHYRFLQLTAP
jgi:hypothetical protein